MSNLRALLHHETLLSTYDAGAIGVTTMLTDRFYTNPTNLLTDDASLLVRPATRNAAPFNRRGAPAHRLALKGKSKRQGAMFHVFNSFGMSTEVFQGLMEPESKVIQSIARRELAEQMEDFDKQHAIQKELATAKMLVYGVVYVDANGQIRESSSGAETLDFGIDASHQGTAGGLAVPFDDSDSDIALMFENIKQQAREENAPEPGVVFCNSTMKRYLYTNNLFQTFAAGMPSGERYIYGEVVENLFGMTWVFYDGTYEDADGTIKKYIPDERLVLVPSTNDWLQPVQGLELVPTRLDIAGSLDQAVSSLAETYGKFAYAKVEHNPVGLNVYAGDNYGYIVRDPNAIWQLDVVFS